jgi:integrase
MAMIDLPRRTLTRAPTKKIALTEQRVADLRATGSTYYINDARTPGLSARITGRGVKSYVYTKKINGRLFRKTLGKADAITLLAARNAAMQFNGEVARGVDLAATGKAARVAAAAKAVTLEDAYRRFLTLKDRRPSTIKDYEMLWRLYVPDNLKRKPVGEITSTDLENLKSVIGRKAKRTANKVVVLVSAIMAKSGRRADNPAFEVERFEERVRTRRLNVEELTRLWKVLNSVKNSLWADFFKILIVTGARRGALCAMRWQDIDLETGVWVVPATWSKNGREMAIPLTAVAVNILRGRRAEGAKSPWVWPSAKAEGGHVVNPEKPWRVFLKAAEINDGVSLHDVRRTLGSSLANSSAAAATISKALGHVSPQSAQAYVHLDVEPARAAIDKALGGICDAT